MTTRGITAQELLENQDPEFLYIIDEVTKQVTPIAPFQPEPAPKKRGPYKKREISK